MKNLLLLHHDTEGTAPMTAALATWSRHMKTIITALALTTAMASPVFARPTTYHDEMTRSVQTAPAYNYYTSSRDYVGSRYVGTDPDPGIQMQLRRDPPGDR